MPWKIEEIALSILGGNLHHLAIRRLVDHDEAGSNPPIFQIDDVQIGSDAVVNLALVKVSPTLRMLAGPPLPCWSANVP